MRRCRGSPPDPEHSSVDTPRAVGSDDLNSEALSERKAESVEHPRSPPLPGVPRATQRPGRCQCLNVSVLGGNRAMRSDSTCLRADPVMISSLS